MTEAKKHEYAEKAAALVAQMTVEEAASQMCFEAPAIPRLGIPEYNWWNEALHGVARAGTATSFPQAIAMAASFDTDLLKTIAETIATEARAKYNYASRRGDRGRYKGLTFWSPNINIFRDPRWGRGHETYGEDPHLTARLGIAFINGLQGEGEVMKTAACAKHYAVHSGPEAIRHEFNAVCSQKDLFETYLPAFEACVTEAGVEAVMGAYNRTLGEPCCASQLLLVDILRGRWGFGGHVVSDCWALLDIHEHHKITQILEESAALALKAGCDLNCGSVYSSLMETYKHGLITEDEIRTSASRLMATRFKLGILGDGSEFDSIKFDAVDSREHRALSVRAAAESCVLLKNDGLLPLDKSKFKRIAVIGPNADSRIALKGNYYGNAAQSITIADGLREYLDADNSRSDDAMEIFSVHYSEGCKLTDAWLVEPPAQLLAEAAETVEYCDAAILVLGLDETIEGEEAHTENMQFDGDKTDLKLPEPQRRLLKTIIDTGKPIVLILMAGSSIDLRDAQNAKNVGAILNAWYPGALGGKAVAKLLFGDASPCGKLPVTFYNSAEDLPLFTDYSMANRTYRYYTGNVLYPFGYGLTYGNVVVKAASYDPKAGAMTVIAENKGTVATKDVLQVYIKPGSEFAPLHPSLCAFKKEHFASGEEKTIEIPIPDSAFTVINDKGERISGGTSFELHIGTGQPDARTAELSGHNSVCISINHG